MMDQRRAWRVWSEEERRSALFGLAGGGSAGYVRALVGGVGGSVSSVLLALSEAVEDAVLEGDVEELESCVARVRACWRLGASCPVWESESVVESLSSLLGRPVSEEEMEMAEACLSFVWVDASRRWSVLPSGVSAEGALERFVVALSAGEVPVCRSSWLSPSERMERRVSAG